MNTQTNFLNGKQKLGGKIQLILEENKKLTETLKEEIKHALRTQYSPRHVPDTIEAVAAIPYTINGKKMEAPVKKILMGMDPAKAVSKDTMRNPEALDGFVWTFFKTNAQL